MTINECKLETAKHVSNVHTYIIRIIDKLSNRGLNHDASKFKSPEIETFAKYTPKLANTTYGSDEYKMFLKEMEIALDHHYKNNRHHPEHFENGISDMNLIDIIEMICDWKAATLRHNDGDIYKSIEINATRFGCSEQLKQILINTAKLFDENEN